ncbi:DUF481 domain-containing protein [Pseudoteredinibacter isoporae]|uniref:Putative salt-induced outer membrane protein n=1 Tax=Pseudoteredinibacter isoporae TaxID=570281 RepID=A0A7X0JX31_9GAMM|nr:DUF481 domain-containing protein [Pseudoteredinibacter isoporae]MBB6523857.1 putative salt-induced outer membrane protein [Pseudoteredinibacter isoporae]NHO89374.1 DUF481 domain-containing protein [Pseudoteredinibacter isoporae]NIB22481.1 DUF481 domain-containing protein [Pseudoteredinibacter isoporae]
MLKLNKTLFAATLLASSLSFAGEWKGEGDLGYNSVAGNSESEALAVKLLIAYVQNDWTHKAEFTANTASTDDKTSAEAYSFNFNSRYEFNADVYGFGNYRYQDDRFSAFEYQSSIAAGVGYHFINTEETILDGEIGAGFRSSERRDTQKKEDEAIILGKLTFKQQITDTTKFESYLLTEAGDENTYVEGEVALKVAMTEQLALKVAYLAKHNTDVSPGTEKTDRYTTVSLNYNF